jgi:integrase
VALHPEARAALSAGLEALTKMLKGAVDPMTLVFCSRARDTTTGLRRHISREQAWRILKKTFHSNELAGKLGMHAMRKTFRNCVYDLLKHDLVKTQRAMGHANVNSTVQYLSFREFEPPPSLDHRPALIRPHYGVTLPNS